MTAKRFTIQDERVIKDNQKYVTENGYVFSYKSDAEEVCNLLNELHKENEWLFKCVENQSALIHELDSRIMAYNMEHKITIKLTEKDLKTLDKVLSYYIHQEVKE